MRCCGTVNGLDKMFSRRRSQRELRRYWKKGLDRPAQTMVELLKARDITGADVLEIGFGIGALHLELLKAGAARAIGLELSPAYVEAAQELAKRLGSETRVEYRLHDIAADPSGAAEADVVLLHRVVCCYPNMAGLVTPAAQRARRVLALSYPRHVWWMRLFITVANTFLNLARRDFRLYLHAPSAIRATAEKAGLAQVLQIPTGPWEITLFERAA